MTARRKLQETGRLDSNIQNKVHQLIEYIETSLEKEGLIKRDFAKAALTGALRFLDEISGAEGIPARKKIALLSQVYEAANRRIEALSAQRPDIPLWANREDRKMSPFDFVEKNYPNYGKGLTTDDIDDKKLLRALRNYKFRHGWPTDFNLPTRTEQLDKIVKNQRQQVDLKGLADAPPSVRRERTRLWKAQTRRLKS